MSAAVVEPPARVLIAAERRPTRARLRLALEADARCSEAENADAAVAAAVRERPDVCLLSLKAGQQPAVGDHRDRLPGTVGRGHRPHQPSRRGRVHGRDARRRCRLPPARASIPSGSRTSFAAPSRASPPYRAVSSRASSPSCSTRRTHAAPSSASAKSAFRSPSANRKSSRFSGAAPRPPRSPASSPSPR